MSYVFAPKIAAPSGMEGTHDPGTFIAGYLPEYAVPLGAFGTAAMRAASVPPLTKELVRLRNAFLQRCELCMRLRRESAVADGLDESAVERMAANRLDSFTDSERVAIQLVDEFFSTPAAVSDDLRDRLLMHYSIEQITEILLCLVVWTGNRVLVALGLDAPVTDSPVTLFDYSSTGIQNYISGAV